MDFKINADSDSGLTNKGRPTNYSSNAVRLRLATLVAALGLVFLAMNEAAKPETWEKLGFSASNPGIATAQAPPSQTTLPSPEPLSIDPTLAKFWNSYFDGLDNQQKKDLTHRFFDNNSESDQQIDERWIKHSKKHLQNYLSKNKLSDSNIDAIRNSQESWTTFLTGRETGSKDEGNENSNASVDLIRKLFRQRIFAVVEDRSAMNRSIESAAWNWAWADLSSANQDYQAATYLQLAGQPDSYRGQKISITGSARGMQKIQLAPDHELGFESYKVLWVKPTESNRVPYCVYVSHLPENFPEPTTGFVELNEDVAIEGIFFKLRSYEATNNQIEICPLIIALNIKWSARDAAITATESWKPPSWMLILFFICMPIAAALMAWSVYRSTSLPSQALKINADNSNDATWNELSQRNDIKSDAERINELKSSE